MAEEEIQLANVVVIDLGSLYTRIGLAGDVNQIVTPSIIGFSKQGSSSEACFLSESDFISQYADFNLSYPVLRGATGNIAHLELLLEHVYSTLESQQQTSSSAVREFPVLLSEPPCNSRVNRDCIARLMFERFGVPALSFESQPVLALYAAGLTTGTSVYQGDSITCVTPICEGCVFAQQEVRQEYGGREITGYLMKMQAEKRNVNYSMLSGERELFRYLKDTMACTAPQEDTFTMQKSQLGQQEQSKQFELPDGTVFQFDQELLIAGEAPFCPDLIDVDYESIHETTFKSIKQCPMDYRKLLFDNMLLSGGTTLMQGYETRFAAEMNKLAKTKFENAEPQVIAHETRRESVWFGASILASMNDENNQAHMITRQKFQELGTAGVVSRFPSAKQQ